MEHLGLADSKPFFLLQTTAFDRKTGQGKLSFTEQFQSLGLPGRAILGYPKMDHLGNDE